MILIVKKKVIIAHGYWGRGGAETSTMQLIDAIKDKCDVYLLTRGGFNLEELNHVSNTSILEKEINLIKLPFEKLLSNTKGGAIWHSLFLRYCRRIAPEYDIRITASQTIGWGLPAIHFLSDVVWNKELIKEYGENIKVKNPFKRFLIAAGKWLAGNSFYDLHPKDIYVGNSKWTAAVSSPYTSNPPVVIYPAVPTKFFEIPLEKRAIDFVSLGRISSEKNIEESISIIEQVRNQGFEVGLTIYGLFEDNGYSKRIMELVKNKPWVKTLGPIYGEEKSRILPTFKFGINTCQREAFGISTAEMIKAGIIPFVPNNGAQIELVESSSIIFNSNQDAVDKIISLLKSEEDQIRISNSLKERSKIFSKEKFQAEVLELINKSV